MTNINSTVALPGTQIAVPPIALGTMYWGTDTTQAETDRLLDLAVERGATFLDTANNYAFWRGSGIGDESEMAIGSWLKSRGATVRDQVTLATKVGARPAVSGGGFETALGLRPAAVAAQLRDSLSRLRTDYVDVLYAHIDDLDMPMLEILGGFQEMVDQGLVRAIAASNLTAPRLREAVEMSKQEMGTGYVGLQNRFTYLTPSPGVDLTPHVLLDDEVAAVASVEDVQLFGYLSLLGGAYTRDDRPLPDAYQHAGTRHALAVLGEVADGANLDPGQAVLAWMGQREQSVIPIVGVSRPEHLESAIEAATAVLPAEAIAALDTARGPH